MIEPKLLKGFRDFLPRQEIPRRRLQNLLENVFLSYGFVPIDTPAMEYTEILLGKAGGETEKQLFRFQDHGGRDVSMRFDLTVPFARFMAQYKDQLYLPFKRYHMAKVWRGEKPQKGRYREFMQCDFDIVGVDSESADFEIMMMMADAMKVLSAGEFKIRFSHRGLFNRFLEKENIADKSVNILRIVDKLGKIGPEEVVKLLSEDVSEERAQKILSFIGTKGNFEKKLDTLTELAGGPCPESQRLSALWKLFCSCGTQNHYELDSSITRGLDYYTGIVFETFLDNLPSIGSVCSGGRYNDLAGLYTKEKLFGVGASVGLDRLFSALEELGLVNQDNNSTKAVIFALEDGQFDWYHKLAQKLREKGIRTEVYPEKKKLAIQFSFAEKKEIPFALICGKTEIENNVYNLKNLLTRKSFDGIDFDRAVSLLGDNR